MEYLGDRLDKGLDFVSFGIENAGNCPFIRVSADDDERLFGLLEILAFENAITPVRGQLQKRHDRMIFLNHAPIKKICVFEIKFAAGRPSDKNTGEFP